MGPDASGVIYRRAAADEREAILDVLRPAGFDRIPSPEMPDFDFASAIVAVIGGRPVGVAGYKVSAPGQGKTTLMAVLPECRGLGVGQRLQELRMLAMLRRGCTQVTTNADLPDTIAWYVRKFGYREVGRSAKEHPFGSADADEWTTLRASIPAWLDGVPPDTRRELDALLDAVER